MTTEYEAITESEWKDLATTEITHLTDEEKDYLPRAWDEWVARVRRDAAREALDGAAAHIDSRSSWLAGIEMHSPKARDVLDYRDTRYPTETED